MTNSAPSCAVHSTRSPTDRQLRGSDAGSAAVEFVFVAPLIALIALAVVQLALAMHIRTTLVAAAAEGARVAAAADREPRDGVAKTRDVLADNLAGSVVESVVARTERRGGVVVVSVQIHGRLPLLGLLGPDTLVVTGHAMEEG